MICQRHAETFTLIGETVLECLSCFNANTADHDTATLILRASLGIMREPIFKPQLQEAA